MPKSSENIEKQRKAYSEHYEEYEHRVSRVHGLLRPFTTGKWRQLVAGKRVLDVGCGNAYVLQEILDQGFERYMGVDIADGMIENNRKSFPDQERIVFEVDDAERLEKVPDGSFDIAISYGCLHHLERPDEALKAIERKLVAGGEFLALEMNRDLPGTTFLGLYSEIFRVPMVRIRAPAYAFARTVRRLLPGRDRSGDDLYRESHPGHPGKRTPEELRGFLGEAGFGRIRVECPYLHLFPYWISRRLTPLFRLQALISRPLLRLQRLRDQGPYILIGAVKEREPLPSGADAVTSG